MLLALRIRRCPAGILRLRCLRPGRAISLRTEAMTVDVGKGFARVCAVLLCASLAGADEAPTTARQEWPDSFVARVEALALLQTLNAALLSHDSATLTLERWCAGHRLASPPRIVALRIPDVDKPPTPEQRREL